ncbi:MAG: hypothetical protein LBF88_12495 [Planctomycetaceae bacterium]|jgi:hypothetical protein|nr:hypothetical protein [Planctomycetaceae bacterium]
MERIRKFSLFSLLSLLLFVTLVVAGCQQALLTALVLVNGTDVKPKYDLLLKGEKRVAVVCRSMASNPYDVQNAPREIARQISKLIDINVRNKKLKVVEPVKIETWLDNCNNDFDNFLEIGRDKTINADLVIGIEIRGFQIRDPHSPYMVQGKCQVNVKVVDCSNGEVLVSEDVMIIDPPNLPISGGSGMEAAFRPRFIQVVAEQIAILFHHHDQHKSRRIDADNLDMHRLQ